ncbi:sulfotransferase family protein [Thalassobacillus hwangdonensis]|uniref:Sulfotransferase family protein n=1 Tax=Thalassobacillus hwangdonensis TaxID=546108 RepID=A0ABW3L4Y2_9BACI
MTKVNLFIAGMSKCGTTSLHNYLNLHENIYMSNFKEPQYFIRNQLKFPHQGPGDRNIDDIIIHSTDYEALFEGSEEYQIRGESSSDYLYFEKSAEEIKEYNPDAKIILMLRNPVDRAYSAYTHLTRDGRETKTFEFALEHEEERINLNYGCMWHLKSMSLYYDKVKHFIDVFGVDQVKVVIFDDFKEDSVIVLNSICDFLEIPKSNFKDEDLINYNISGVPKNKKIMSLVQNKWLKQIIKNMIPSAKAKEKVKGVIFSKLLTKEKMQFETRIRLIDYFSNDINKLEELLNINLSKWKK